MEPFDGAERSWLRPSLLTLAIVLLVFLIASLWRVRRRIVWRSPATAPRPRGLGSAFDPDQPLPPSLRRAGFSAATQTAVFETYATQQVVSFPRGAGQPAPGPADFAGAVQQVRQPDLRRAFHIRHVVADNLLRRAVWHVVRAPRDDLVRLVRELFVTFRADSLVATWDDVASRLPAGGGENDRWFQTLGSRLVGDLRVLISQVPNQLYLSESQGNLHAGTFPDVTEECIALLGRDAIRRVLSATVRLIEGLGLLPRLVTVEGEIMLGYENAAGRFRHFGYRPRLSHDIHLSPLPLLEDAAAERVMRNTPLQVQILACYAIHPWGVIRVLTLLLLRLLYHQGRRD